MLRVDLHLKIAFYINLLFYSFILVKLYQRVWFIFYEFFLLRFIKIKQLMYFFRIIFRFHFNYLSSKTVDKIPKVYMLWNILYPSPDELLHFLISWWFELTILRLTVWSVHHLSIISKFPLNVMYMTFFLSTCLDVIL